jgi:hypothetical protein
VAVALLDGRSSLGPSAPLNSLEVRIASQNSEAVQYDEQFGQSAIGLLSADRVQLRVSKSPLVVALNSDPAVSDCLEEHGREQRKRSQKSARLEPQIQLTWRQIDGI